MLLLLATVLIISNTIKLTIYSRAQEIEIMKLVGATNLFIRIPFFIEGIILGLTGSLIALGLLFLGYKMLVLALASKYSVFFGTFNPIFLPHPMSSALITLGVLIGLGGCALSMGRFLKA